MKLVASERKNTGFDNQFPVYQSTTKPVLKYHQITDAEGIPRAYKQGDYYVHGRTMFVAGSHTVRDWFDDITKVPAWGDLKESERYQKALKEFKENNAIDTVVGHSLGGSVSLELQKNYPSRIKKSRTYGAPVMDLLGSEAENTDRYRQKPKMECAGLGQSNT